MSNVVRTFWVVLLAGVAWGQQPPPVAPNPAQPKPHAAKSPGASAVEVPPTATVLKIPGICPPAPKKTAAPAAKCETVITRAEFERFAAVASPNLPAAQRRSLAQRYSEVLALVQHAVREGLDKDPQVQEQLRLVRLQILANAYTRDVQKRLSNPSEAEIEKYYNENGSKFDEISVQRLYVPKPMAKDDKPADEGMAKALAESLRVRAAAGEEFDKLQAEAMKAGDGENASTTPPTKLEARRRNSLPPGHEHLVFEAAAGQVTPVYEEASGFFVYKVDSKRRLPLADVRKEIVQATASQKISDALESARRSVTPIFDETYFAAPPEPQVTPQPPDAGPASPKPATSAPPEPAKPDEKKQPGPPQSE